MKSGKNRNKCSAFIAVALILLASIVVLAACEQPLTDESTGSAETESSQDAVDNGDQDESSAVEETEPHRLPDPYVGADVSEILYAERAGVQFADIDGTEKSGLEILRDHGYDLARIRVNVEPPGNFAQAVGGQEGNYGMHTDVDYLVDTAIAADELGFRIALNFHYSDWWADPGNQWIPEVWWNDPEKNPYAGEDDYPSLESLEDKVYEHTKEVMELLRAEGIIPEIVQIGNEMQGGMLHPVGAPWGDPWGWSHEEYNVGDWDAMVSLIQAGIRGVEDAMDGAERPLIMMHHHYDGDDVSWFFDELTDSGVDYDLIGLSYYPMWHNTIEGFAEDMQDLHDHYNGEIDIYIVEVAYYWTESEANYFAEDWSPYYGIEPLEEGPFPETQQGQFDYLQAVRTAVEDIESIKGMWYWGAGWSQATTGAGWLSAPGWADDDAATRSLFDHTGKATKGIEGLFVLD